MTYAAFPVLVPLLLYVFFLMFLGYAAVQNAGWARLPLFVRILLMPAGAAFFLLDVAINATVATIAFCDPPRTWTFSQRCAAYISGPDGWRKRQAIAIVGTLLLPFTKNY